MKYIIFVILILFAGCEKESERYKVMTNDQIIVEHKKCKDAGMKGVNHHNIFEQVYLVTCEEKP